MAEVKAMILDIDGTLVLSNDQHAKAFEEAAKAVGIVPDFTIIRRLIGKGSDKLLPEAFGLSLESETGRKLDGLKGEIFRDRYLPELQPAPGARALLRRLRQENVKLIVGTSANKKDAGRLLDQAGIHDLIDHIVSSDDVEASKPDPDIVCSAIQKSGENERSVIMLGDTPYDVESALRAGIRIIAVRCGGWTDSELAGAAAIYDDPADLLNRYADSPIAPTRVR